jgi:AcrR family transcriptional regulator
MKSNGSSGTRPYRQGARAEAAEATGSAIVDAFVGRLMRQWYDEITLDLIARDAGVTVQTVVRRFGGKEGLLGEAARALTVQIESRRAAPAGNLERRVRHLIADYEQVGDAVIRLLALEPRHKALTVLLNHGRARHREWVAGLIAERLKRLGPAAREGMLDALVIVTDAYAWKLLRRDMGRSVPEAAAAMHRMIVAVLDGFAGSDHAGVGR